MARRERLVNHFLLFKNTSKSLKAMLIHQEMRLKKEEKKTSIACNGGFG